MIIVYRLVPHSVADSYPHQGSEVGNAITPDDKLSIMYHMLLVLRVRD